MADTNTLVSSRYGVAIPQKLPPTDVEKQEIAQNVRDIHFDLDQFYLRPEALNTLQANAQWLRAHPDRFIAIEGHADERGSIVYNVVLSDMRARATREALLEFGVPASQIIFATGWGKLYPLCTASDEACWSQNRRAHFTAW
jgi:peptidoglycan-associated lipoprotein